MIENKQKIVVIATFFWPVSGDVEDYPYNIARILKEAKEQGKIGNFVVETPNVWPDGKKIDRPLEDSFRGIPIRRFPVYSNLTWFTKLWFPDVKNYNIIHSCGGYRHPDMFIAFLKRGKAKFFISPFFPMHPRKNILTKLAIWLIDASIGRYVISHSTCCFAETKQEAEWLKEMGAKKIVILPNPLPEEIFKKGNATRFRKKYKIKGKMIFFLARHVPIKNFEEIIEVMPKLNDTTLVIGGEHTEYTKKCKELAKKLRVADKVIWPGFMNSQQKRDAYTACDIYVSSSIRESLGPTVIEAMAQGKPVIGTNAGGLPGVVPDKFCLYEQGNKEELKKKIISIFSNKKLARELAKKGKKKAENYKFEKVKKSYLKALKEIRDVV